MTVQWDHYQRMLEMQVDETRSNVEYAEKQLKQAKAKHDVAVRGLESFNTLLEEKMKSLEDGK